jgi:hypothetical protein
MRSSIGNERVERERIRLIAALALGCVTPVAGLVGCASTFGRRPEPLPPDRSVWSAEGGFRVNGAPVDENVRIRAGDSVETGDEGPLVFAVGETAFLLRARSRLQLEADSGTPDRVRGIDLKAGGLLTVFAPRAYRVRTPLAVLGIRGTGLYAAVEEDRDYICTCYGSVELSARADPASREAITSVRHDAPRLVTATGPSGTRIRQAPFRDHTDEELLLIESLVGRTPPFPVPGDAYGMPRRGAY